MIIVRGCLAKSVLSILLKSSFVVVRLASFADDSAGRFGLSVEIVLATDIGMLEFLSSLCAATHAELSKVSKHSNIILSVDPNLGDFD